jgi:hypothetical protein
MQGSGFFGTAYSGVREDAVPVFFQEEARSLSEEEITVTIGDHLKRAHAVELNGALRRKAVDLILLDPT